MSCASLAEGPDPYHIRQELQKAPKPVPGRHSNIVHFYANRSVLITGASGFIGKVLIEKLLRTCPSIRRIFVLIRPKWNKAPNERLRELLDAPLFDAVRDNINKRIVLVEGDVTQPNLGLNGNNLSRIIKEVSVIFHSAATVKFDEPLKQSVGINIAGTKNMVEVCRRIPHLAALVHVSTAYANCDKPEIDEHVYPVDMDPEKLIQMAEWLDQATLQELKRSLLGARPNTYTYTKALAEWLLVRSARDLPIVVCRPSIVVASSEEPFRGWIDNVNGPTGVILGAGKGLIRSMFAEKSFIADLVPVDMVINLVVALGWFAYINRGHKQLAESAESFTESILSGRSVSPTASAGSSSSAASTSGDDTQYELVEQQQQQQQLKQQRSAGHDNSLEPPAISVNEKNDDLSAAEQQHQPFDDGYGSLRNSGYNSVASSSDTASNSSSTSLTLTQRNHHHHNHHHQHRRRHARVSTLVVGNNDRCCLANEQQLPIEQTPIDQELELRLNTMRLKTRAKLNESGLPEEIADVPVFHCTSGSVNPVTWGQIQVLILAALAVFPSNTTYRYPCGSFTNNKYMDDFYRITLHYIPGYIADFVTRLFGGKPVLVRIFNKFDQAARVLKAFTSREWKFKYENGLFLFNELMNEEDRRLFNFDIKSLNWESFSRDYVVGVRKFMLKESMESLDKARLNLKLIYYRNLSLQVLFTATLAYYFVSKFSGLM